MLGHGSTTSLARMISGRAFYRGADVLLFFFVCDCPVVDSGVHDTAASRSLFPFAFAYLQYLAGSEMRVVSRSGMDGRFKRPPPCRPRHRCALTRHQTPDRGKPRTDWTEVCMTKTCTTTASKYCLTAQDVVRGVVDNLEQTWVPATFSSQRPGLMQLLRVWDEKYAGMRAAPLVLACSFGLVSREPGSQHALVATSCWAPRMRYPVNSCRSRSRPSH
jgi:hypothetical protein